MNHKDDYKNKKTGNCGDKRKKKRNPILYNYVVPVQLNN